MNQRSSVKLIIDEEKKLEVSKYYSSYKKENSGEYIEFYAKKGDIVIAIYSSKKEREYKLMFIGVDPLKEAKLWDKNATISLKKEKINKEKAHWIALMNQIGSDEVGTGDLFGPITVAASYVKGSDIPFLKEIGVDDSKKLSDKEILHLGEILLKKIPYSQLSLDNVKYNELIDKGYNLNKIKAKMHNRVLLNLKKKYPNTKAFFVDQFVEKESYFSYLDKDEEKVENITFKTKGESYFPSVAVASIIARYSFLKKMETLGKKYNLTLPFGAGKNVTKFASDFKKKFGEEELTNITKKNFSNLKNLVN